MNNDKLIIRDFHTRYYTSHKSFDDLELILNEFKDNINSIICDEQYSFPKLTSISICFEYNRLETDIEYMRRKKDLSSVPKIIDKLNEYNIHNLNDIDYDILLNILDIYDTEHDRIKQETI